MRVAVLVDRFLPVSETFVAAQLRGLLARGHDVDILALGPTSPDDTNQDALRPELASRVRYLQTPRRFRARLRETLRSGAALGRRHPRLLARTLNVLRYRRAALSLDLLRSAASISLGRSQGRYDVIHAQFGSLGLAALRLKEVGALTGRLVTSFRGYDANVDIRRHQDRYRRLFSEGDLFCPVSESLREILLAAGCSEEKIALLRSGVDCRRFTYHPRFPGAQEPVRLLTVARLVEKKGVAYAVEAVAGLVHRGKAVSYVIAGDGPLRASLEKLVGGFGLEPHVKFIGWVDHDRIRGLLDEAHILVAPSVTGRDGDQEGIPNVVKEAMATGLPVVSTLHSGIPELVDDGASGFLVPERDAQALADRLTFLADHPEVWPEMGRAGRRKVETEFDMEQLNDRLVALYAQVLDRGAPAGTRGRRLAVAR